MFMAVHAHAIALAHQYGISTGIPVLKSVQLPKGPDGCHIIFIIIILSNATV
jgi:hypothetical protein